MTFDSKVIFEKHLCSVSRAASQRLSSLRMSWLIFHDRSLLGRCFQVLCCLFWNTVLQCSARLPVHTLNYWTVLSVISVFRLAVCSSVTLFVFGSTVYMLYKIRCYPIHSLCGALPVLYVPVLVTRGAPVAHRHTSTPPRRTLIPFSVSLWNDLADPVFDAVGLAGFKIRANALSLP